MSTKTQNRIVAYYRVSTQKQGRSGLGLEAQRAAVEAWAEYNRAVIVTEHTEIESGKKSDRANLKAALADCKRLRARLVIAKLDRLSRNVAFIATLMESTAEFAACDLPDANRLMLHIMASIAEHEARTISQRTKDALAAKKARGALLGASRPESRNLKYMTDEKRVAALAKSLVVRKQLADEFVAEIMPRIEQAIAAGAQTYKQIAEALTLEGNVTRRERPWNPMQVRRTMLKANPDMTARYKRHRKRRAA